MKDSAKPGFGERVRFTARYVRMASVLEYPTSKRWVELPCKEKCGLFLGLRTLYDGVLGEDPEFIPTSHFRAALVCPNERTNPIYVPLHAITRRGTGE